MEEVVWFVVPLIFAGATSWAFERITRVRKVWPFAGAALLSALAYLFVRPACGCIGVDQVLGALALAVPFNFIVFLCGFVVAFIIVRVNRA